MEVLLPHLKKGFVWDWGKGLGLLGHLEGLPGVYFVSDEALALCSATPDSFSILGAVDTVKGW